MAPKLKFCGPNERLDRVSLQLIRSKHPLLWMQVVSTYPMFESAEDFKITLQAVYQERADEINGSTVRYTTWWGSVETEWMCYMVKLFKSSFFDNALFTAHQTILSLYVRDLTTESFLVPAYAEKKRLLEVCAHEICHFFFYRKLRELMPDKVQTIRTSRKLWLVSEAIVPLIFGTEESEQILGTCTASTYACSNDLLQQLKPVFDKWKRQTISMHKMIFEMIQIINQPNESTGGAQCSM